MIRCCIRIVFIRRGTYLTSKLPVCLWFPVWQQPAPARSYAGGVLLGAKRDLFLYCCYPFSACCYKLEARSVLEFQKNGTERICLRRFITGIGVHSYGGQEAPPPTLASQRPRRDVLQFSLSPKAWELRAQWRESLASPDLRRTEALMTEGRRIWMSLLKKREFALS